jgi:hypothetical protein
MRALPAITANNQSAIFNALLAGALCSKHMNRNDDQKRKSGNVLLMLAGRPPSLIISAVSFFSGFVCKNIWHFNRVGLVQLVRFIVVKLTRSNHRFDMSITFTVN